MAKEFKSGPMRIPPQDIDSEKALLGSIMLKPETMHDIVDVVDSESFYAEKNRLIFKVMLDLHSKHEPIDLLSVSSRLREKKKLETIGGSSYLTELVNIVPSAANIKHYAKTVQKKRVLRELIDAADHIS